MESRSSSHYLSERILATVISNKLTVGDTIPSIKALSEDFGVSPSTVREAIARLAGLGFLEIKHGKGTTVSRPSISDFLKIPLWQALIEGLTVPEIVEARAAIEAFTTRLCVERASGTDIDGIMNRLGKMRAALDRGDMEDFYTYDSEFHECIARASKNRVLVELVVCLRDILALLSKGNGHQATMNRAYEYHRKIADAIRTGDADQASDLMVSHIKEIDRAADKERLEIYCDTLGTGSMGGSFYRLGQVISSLIAQYTRIKPSVRATGGGIENVKRIQEKDMVLSITQVDTAVHAVRGTGEFDKPHTELRYLCCLPTLGLQVVTRSSARIRRLEDLKGKKVAVGAYGGASVPVAQDILSLVGLEAHKDYEPQVHPLRTSAELLQKGAVDALFCLSMGSSDALVELALSCPVDLLPLEDSLIQAFLQNHPYWIEFGVPPFTYPGQAKQVRTVGIPCVLIAHKDLSDEDAYAITAAIVDNARSLGFWVSPESSFNQAAAISEVMLPRHPGASLFIENMASRRTQ